MKTAIPHRARLFLALFLFLHAHVASAEVRRQGGVVRRPASERRPAEDDIAYARIRFHLAGLAENARHHRILLGAVFLGTGMLFTGAFIASDRLRTGEPRRLALGVLGVSAAVSFVGGAVLMFFPTEYEELPAAYLRKNDLSASRVVAAEALLGSLAHRARAARTLIGSGLVALGAADIAWHFAEGATPNTSFLVYKGALLGFIGLGLLVVKWPAELEYEGYFAEDSGARASSVQWNVAPWGEGAGFALSLRFP